MTAHTARHESALKATLAGLIDRVRERGEDVHTTDDLRLEGRVVMVTGANRGLGLATATELAQRGAEVIMACRSGLPEAVDVVRAASGSATVQGQALDLADPDSVRTLAQRLRQDGVRLDVLVLNAGVVPSKDRATSAGLNALLHINYLGNVQLVRALLADGTLPNRSIAANAVDGPRPRIVAVSSESHRSSRDLVPRELGAYFEYGVGQSVGHYGWSKALLQTWIADLERTLHHDGAVDIAVHSLCPGAVNSGIAREAPSWVKPLLVPTMWLFFQPPAKACQPVVWLCGATEIEGETGVYLHMRKKKEMDPRCLDTRLHNQLRAATDRLLAEL